MAYEYILIKSDEVTTTASVVRLFLGSFGFVRRSDLFVIDISSNKMNEDGIFPYLWIA